MRERATQVSEGPEVEVYLTCSRNFKGASAGRPVCQEERRMERVRKEIGQTVSGFARTVRFLQQQ